LLFSLGKVARCASGFGNVNKAENGDDAHGAFCDHALGCCLDCEKNVGLPDGQRFVVGMSACHFSALSMAAGTMWTTGSVPVHGEASLRFKRVWRVE